MRALVLHAKDTPLVLEERPDPTPRRGQARVRLAAAALNHRDLFISRGMYPGLRLPTVLGSDGCGVVDAVGDPADADWIGQRVVLDPSLDWGDDPRVQGPDYGILGMPRDGTFAEAVVVPVGNLHRAPRHLTDHQAAALPLAGLTAWRALMTRAALRPDEKVLVTGIGGGVAIAALQLARAGGAEVWVTSSKPHKIEAAERLGARGGFLYTDDDWRKQAGAAVKGGFDVIIDGAGGPGFGDLVRLLAPAGRLAFYGGTAGRWPAILPQHLFFRQVSILACTMGSHAEFAALVPFVETHGIVPVVDRVFDLADGQAACDHLRAAGHFGKVVLAV